MKQTLLNTFLVAAGLLAGTMGAWAEETTTTIYERGTSDATAWTSDNLTDFTASGGTYELTEYGAQLTSSNGTVEAKKTITPTANTIVNVEAVWLGMSNTSAYFSDGNGSYFRFGNIYVLENDQDKKSAYSLSAFSKDNYTTFTGPGTYRNYDTSTHPFYVIKIEVNTATNTLNYLRVYGSDNESKTLLEVQNQPLTDADYTTIGFGYIKSKSAKTQQVEILKSIKVTETTQTISIADYKVKYVDESGNELKDAETRTGQVGGAITLTTADKANFFTSDNTKKYIYASDDASEKTIAEDGKTEVTVKFREAATWSYTVNAVDGDGATLKQIGTGSYFEGEKVSVPYDEYINVEGSLYKSSAESSSFKKGVELTENNITATVKYSASDITGVVYYSEGEDIEGASVVNSGNADARCSGAAAGYSATDLKFVTLPAGTYKINAVVYSPTSAGGSFSIKNGDEVVYGFTSGNANRTVVSSDNIVLSGETELSIANCSANAAYDLIYIQRVATDAALSITSAGYATFSPASNVTIPSDVTAYTVKVNDDNSTITLNEISSDAVIPAGTGVLVAGAEGEYTFAGTTADATELTNNDLKVAGESTVADGKQYGLAQVDGKVGFFKIKSGDTLTAGKAYLEVSEESAAKMSFFALDGETTGINAVETSKTADNAFYTLQGVRVAKPSKGLYIMGGKKVIVK